MDNSGALISMENTARQFAFASPVWQSLKPTVCYLSEQHRQEDAPFLEFLSALRNGSISASHHALLETRRMSAAQAIGMTHLFSHNADVDRLNEIELRKLAGESHIFQMETRGPRDLITTLQRGCLSPENLSLKIGARVMFTKNDAQYLYANGTLGTVTGFSNDGLEGSEWPIVTTLAGREIEVIPEDWKVEEGGRILARITQVPLRLAWAMTVHKSQGMSLDAAHMDLSGAFEHGQGYVALSRVRTLAGLSLVGWNQRALEVSPEIQQKDAEFRASSLAAKASFSAISADEQLRREYEFIRVCGGSIEEKTLPVSQEKPIREKKEKGKRWEQTLVLVHESKTLQEIADTQNLKINTVVSHLEELLILDKLVPSDLAYLTRGDEEIIIEIQSVFRSRDSHLLKPVYEHFGGRVPYETIHLARLLMR